MTTFYRIYMDDSGNVDHHATNEAELRYGSITAVILTDEYLRTRFNDSFEALSKRHFGSDASGNCHNLHRRVIAKPPKEGPFSVLNEPGKKEKWERESLRMIETAQFTVVSACVDKIGWYYRFPEWSGNFYEVLVQAALERCFYFLKNRDGEAEVNIENKTPKHNEAIKRAYRAALTDGFEHISATNLRRRFRSLEPNILTKKECRPGMQLADLLAGPALQHIRFMNTSRHPIIHAHSRSVGEVLEAEKFYREGDKGPEGYGRVWRPQR